MITEGVKRSERGCRAGLRLRSRREDVVKDRHEGLGMGAVTASLYPLLKHHDCQELAAAASLYPRINLFSNVQRVISTSMYHDYQELAAAASLYPANKFIFKRTTCYFHEQSVTASLYPLLVYHDYQELAAAASLYPANKFINSGSETGLGIAAGAAMP
ncbi:hypothetical protein FIBSPDRAFT_887194 [Athelia psychrophila]|uniref:Uncharacterized protein n=1 Tax=Athelia psychrophila TaxID=1759441 RepID=A0A166Q380_9AGAM|nr:hypothetical protein FIBSPDRAFT_887194 [Fibularhizoctonia sp. CBS 109695]